VEIASLFTAARLSQIHAMVEIDMPLKFKNDSVRVYVPGSIKGYCQTSDVKGQVLASW
jgi:hypothetical protein